MKVKDRIKVLLVKYYLSLNPWIGILWIVLIAGYFLSQKYFNLEFSTYSDIIGLFLAVSPFIYMSRQPLLPFNVRVLISYLAAQGKSGATMNEINKKLRKKEISVGEIILMLNYLLELEIIKTEIVKNNGKVENRYLLWLF